MRRTIELSALALAASLGLPAMSAAAQVPEQSKTAGQIFADAMAATSKVKDFHVSGRIVQGSQLVVLNLSMSKTGGGGSVQVKGATLELVDNQKYLYMKADAASWKIFSRGQAGASAAQLLANKWLKVPVGNPSFSSFANFTFSDKFLAEMTAGKHRLVKGGVTTYGGRPAVALTDTLRTGKIYIALSSPHYLLGIAADNASGKGSVQFTDFGDAPMPATPLHAITLPGA